MSRTSQDRWAAWVLHRRHGGDPRQARSGLAFLAPVRDRVLENARLQPREVLLDVGTGDGLIAFGALDRVGDLGTVIFSDVSQELLDHCRSLARDLGVLERCQFLRAAAQDLRNVPDASVDAVTTRSVLIYVMQKEQAFGEFHRVLKPGGCFSIFEPINAYFPDRPEVFWHYDVHPVADLAAKVLAACKREHPTPHPMTNFDERDLLRLAEGAGFEEIHLDLQVNIGPGAWFENWEGFLRSAGNPLDPTLEEAMDEALTPGERERFERHLRPLVEDKQGVKREAFAYLWAIRGAC